MKGAVLAVVARNHRRIVAHPIEARVDGLLGNAGGRRFLLDVAEPRVEAGRIAAGRRCHDCRRRSGERGDEDKNRGPVAHDTSL